MSSSGEKTEQPTEKRLKDARRKGQVAKSQDLTSALLLLAIVVTLWLGGRHVARTLYNAMRDGIVHAATFDGDFDKTAASGALWDGVGVMASVLLPLFVTIFLVAALAGYLQVGSIFAFDSVKPNLNKLNPAESFKQKFLKGRPYVELLKTVVKMTIAASVVLLVLWSARGEVVALLRQPAGTVASYTLSLMLGIGLKVGLAFLLLGGADYFLQRFFHLKEMKMTKQEVKEEWKQNEGDPLIKSMRRQMHREIVMQAMMAAVPKADVVVANPTHVAVALRYDSKEMTAPTVVAKGAELLAAKIRELAAEAGVPIMTDVPLARALYELDIDSEIPEELYGAVAAVLQWVYSLSQEEAGR